MRDEGAIDKLIKIANTDFTALLKIGVESTTTLLDTEDQELVDRIAALKFHLEEMLKKMAEVRMRAIDENLYVDLADMKLNHQKKNVPTANVEKSSVKYKVPNIFVSKKISSKPQSIKSTINKNGRSDFGFRFQKISKSNFIVTEVTEGGPADRNKIKTGSHFLSIQFIINGQLVEKVKGKYMSQALKDADCCILELVVDMHSNV